LSGCGSVHSVGQAPVMQREFSTQSMLVALDRIDFVNRQIELKGQAVDLLTWGPEQLELGIAEPSRPEVELGIKVVAAVGLSDPAESIAPAHGVAVSPIIQRGSGARHVGEDQRLIDLVLEAHVDVDDFVIACRTGAEVGDGGRKIIRFVAERLASAERVLGAGGGRGGLSLGGGRNSKRTERQQDCHGTKNPKDRWN
jgi:hypothetical protein